jgi:hypothetical protein
MLETMTNEVKATVDQKNTPNNQATFWLSFDLSRVNWTVGKVLKNPIHLEILFKIDKMIVN